MTQEYDKNGNRTRMHRNTVGGYEADYGNSEDLSYTYNVVNQLTAISDADDGNFSCTVTCDANNNITQIEEVQTDGPATATLITNFTYDWGNRLTQHKTQQFNNSQNEVWETLRDHTIDAIGRTAKSGYLTYWNMELPGSPDTLEHVYDRARHIQNYDGSSSYGEVWHWAGAANQHSGPLRSPNADTASQKAYNIANDHTPQRRTFTNPTSEGDQRHLYGQGKPQAKNSSGSGANWYLGTASESLSAGLKVYSRTMFDGTVTATDMDRATDAREKGRIGIFGTGNAYAGSYGRVTSERIGRDLNPLGRGDGNAFVGGAQNYGRIAPTLPLSNASPGGWGNSVNNSGIASSPCAGHSQCEEGSEYRNRSDTFFYSSECFFWWLDTLDLGVEYDRCGCGIARACIFLEECEGACDTLGDWIDYPACCRCMACACRENNPGVADECFRIQCAVEDCVPPVSCTCGESQDPGNGGGTPPPPPPNCDCKGCVDACTPGDMTDSALLGVLLLILGLIGCLALCKGRPGCISRCYSIWQYIMDIIGAVGDVKAILGYACCAWDCYKSLCDDCDEVIECFGLCTGSFGGGGFDKFCEGGIVF